MSSDHRSEGIKEFNPPPLHSPNFIYIYFTIKSLSYISIYALAHASEPSVTLHANMLTLTV